MDIIKVMERFKTEDDCIDFLEEKRWGGKIEHASPQAGIETQDLKYLCIVGWPHQKSESNWSKAYVDTNVVHLIHRTPRRFAQAPSRNR